MSKSASSGASSTDAWVALGRIRGALGVKGALRVESFADDVAWILRFPVWWLGEDERRRAPKKVLDGRPHGKGLSARLEGVEDRDAARALNGTLLWARREDYPEAEPDTFYWSDLVGLQVETASGEGVGTVQSVFPTGANDVIQVQGSDGEERLLPFIDDVVLEVDLGRGVIVVQLMEGL